MTAGTLTPRPAGAAEASAFGAVVVAVCAFAFLRVPCDDTLWHLGTARLRAETGGWPTSTTFSWTHPDHTLWQQYPLYQWILLRLHEAGGWEALSALTGAGWLLVFALFVRWSGGARRAASLHLAWAIAAFALQRRMVLRPDLFSMVWFAIDLLAIDAYRRGHRLAAMVPPLCQIAWVRSHQLWPLGDVVQALWLGGALLSRRAPPEDATTATPPVAPVAVALAASVAATLASPLGALAFGGVAQTWGSVAHHRGDVQEFAAIWQSFPERELAIACALPAAWAMLRARRRSQPLEIGLWLATLALALLAVRGFVFFGVTSIAIFTRTLGRLPSGPGTPTVSAPVRRFLRAATLLTTFLLAAVAVRVRWVAPPLALGGTQPGLGRTIGDWPDVGIAFLRRDLPPGRMMNMPWSLAAPIWFLPGVPVYVDPRFESYPRAFLEEVIRSYRDDATLDRLIARDRPSWIFAEHCHDGVRARLARLIRSRGWHPVHADARTVVIVRPGAGTDAYLARHRESLPAEPEDLLAAPARLRAEQLDCYRRLREALGR